jgi:pimeloyl-ACP methyl ester carboxylesterase
VGIVSTPPTTFITLQNRRLEVRRIEADRSDAATLVFLHEGIGSVSLWRDFPAALCAASGLHGLIYSRHGYGQSDVLDTPRGVDYMHREALEVLPAILDAFGIDRHVLVGHSDGASIALIHAGAVAQPGLAGVIVEAPHVFIEPMNIAAIEGTRGTFETTDLRDRLARHHRDPVKTFRGWNDVWLSPPFRDWNIESYLSGIRVPVLAIQGEDDEYGTMEQLDRIRDRIRAGVAHYREVRLTACGHSPHRDQPQTVQNTMRDFISTLPGLIP